MRLGATPRAPVAETVGERMIHPIATIRDGQSLALAHRLMTQLDVSALPVVDDRGGLAGVVSRTDLLRAARVRLVEGTRDHLLNLPDEPVRFHMHPIVEVVAPEARLVDAARRMVEDHYHRLFVAREHRLVGVIGTHEMMEAISRHRMRIPISDIMTASVITVRVDDPIALALDRMAASHLHGLVVVDGGWPLGSFSDVDALRARDAAPMDPVERWMSPAVLSLPAEMTADRAARAALATRAKRIVAVAEDRIRGVVSGMDFTRLVADAP